MKTRHTVKDGRKHFSISQIIYQIFILRIIKSFIMFVLSILLFIVCSWFGQVTAEFLQVYDVMFKKIYEEGPQSSQEEADGIQHYCQVHEPRDLKV